MSPPGHVVQPAPMSFGIINKNKVNKIQKESKLAVKSDMLLMKISSLVCVKVVVV